MAVRAWTAEALLTSMKSTQCVPPVCKSANSFHQSLSDISSWCGYIGPEQVFCARWLAGIYRNQHLSIIKFVIWSQNSNPMEIDDPTGFTMHNSLLIVACEMLSCRTVKVRIHGELECPIFLVFRDQAKLFFSLWTLFHMVLWLLYVCCPEWLYQSWEPWPPVQAEQCDRFRATYCSDKAEIVPQRFLIICSMSGVVKRASQQYHFLGLKHG